MLNHDPLLDLSKEQGEQPCDMHHELQCLRYAKLKKQWRQEWAEAKHLCTTARCLEKRENNHRKKDLMLGSKNLADLRIF